MLINTLLLLLADLNLTESCRTIALQHSEQWFFNWPVCTLCFCLFDMQQGSEYYNILAFSCHLAVLLLK